MSTNLSFLKDKHPNDLVDEIGPFTDSELSFRFCKILELMGQYVSHFYRRSLAKGVHEEFFSDQRVENFCAPGYKEEIFVIYRIDELYVSKYGEEQLRKTMTELYEFTVGALVEEL